MLKFDIIVLLMLTLVYDGELPRYVSIILAFLAGISIKTGSDLYKRTFTARKFFIRLFFIFGLSVAVMFAYQEWKFKVSIVWPIMVITLFSELLVVLIEKHGEILLNKWFTKKSNE